MIVDERKHRRSARIPLWRLDLACGHTAFGLDSEPHRKGGYRACAACGPTIKCRIVHVTAINRGGKAPPPELKAKARTADDRTMRAGRAASRKRPR